MEHLEKKLDNHKMTHLEIYECQKVFIISCVEQERILWETGQKTRKRGQAAQKWHQITNKVNSTFINNRLNGKYYSSKKRS